MSHRRAKHLRMAARAEQRVATTIPAPTASASIGSAFDAGWSSNGHLAASWSRNRGYIYFPQLDTRREIAPSTRIEIMRKARWFCVNHGLPRRIVFGLSRLAAGTGLTPHALTKDEEWNRLAESYAASRWESPFSFDIGGRFDFYSAQAFSLACHYRDGDQATLLTSSATDQAMFAFYEGHQIGSGRAGEEQGWFDGVRADRNNRAQQYRFLGDNDVVTDIDATNVAFIADYERAGQHRSNSILEPATNHLHDATDILSFIKTGVKLNNLYGYWFEKAPGTTPGPHPFGHTAGPTSQVTVDATSGATITLEQIIGGGAIPELEPGVSLKFNNNAHPHPNQLGLLDYLIRDIAWGCGVAPDLLWNIAALGGANTRFVLADAQSWIEKEQEKLIRLFLQRAWLYTIAKGMKAGTLRPCKDPEWWKVGWIPPPRLTVDFGRDGRLYIEQNRSAMLSLKTIYGWQGQNWQPQLDQILDEVAYFKAGLAKRKLAWDDWQQWRNTVGFRPADDGTASASATPSDPVSRDPAEASAQLAELAKDPAAASRYLEHLRAQPAPISAAA
jgi:capsid protein